MSRMVEPVLWVFYNERDVIMKKNLCASNYISTSAENFATGTLHWIGRLFPSCHLVPTLAFCAALTYIIA